MSQESLDHRAGAQRPYTEIASLRHVYLEDSWVLAVRVDTSVVEFLMDVVLVPSHPSYMPPRAGEQHCYRAGALRFANVSSVSWTDRGDPPATDASGEEDYGHIDSLEFDGKTYSLEGDWGRMQIESREQPTVELFDDEFGQPESD